MKLRQQKRLLVACSLFVLLMSGGVVLWAVMFPVGLAPTVAARPPKRVRQTKQEPLPTLESLQTLWDVALQRPMVDPKPKTEIVKTQVKSAPKPTRPSISLHLTSIFRGSKVSIAVFNSSSQQGVSLTEGESIDGWRLDEIQAGQVTLSQGAFTETIKLSISREGGRQSNIQAAKIK